MNTFSTPLAKDIYLAIWSAAAGVQDALQYSASETWHAACLDSEVSPPEQVDV